jgi:hypothetical protein
MGAPDLTPTRTAGRENDIEFIKAMLELAKEDARQVYLRVTAAGAVAVLFVTQLPFARLLALDTFTRIAFLTGLAAVTLAGLAHFQYVQAIHLSRVKLARCLKTLDTVEVDRIWTETWEKRGWFHNAGHVLFAIGGLALAYVLYDLFL